MQHLFAAEVITSAEGLTRIQITDTSGSHPPLYVVERSVDEQLVWIGSEDCAFSLCQEQAMEALPFLLNFLETGRLVKR